MTGSRGRPANGSSDARERILGEARARFRELGYTETSLRGIATACSVDPALVRYHFGTKRQLFATVLGLTVAPTDVLERALDGGPAVRMPERLTALVVTAWEQPDAVEPLMRLAHDAVQDPVTMRLFRGYLEAEVVSRLRDRLSGPARAHRAAAAIEVIVGLVFARYILKIPSMADVSARDAFRRTLPAMRAALTKVT